MRCLIWLGLCGLLASTSLSAADRPNVIVILVDDMGWSDIGTPPWKHGFVRSLNRQAGSVYFYNQTGSKGGAKLYLNGEERALNDSQFGEWYGTFLWSQWGLKFVDEANAIAAQYEAWAKRTRVVTANDSTETAGTAKKQRKAQKGAKTKSP